MRALVPAANGDVSLAEFGIVYVDEVDKLAVKASQGVFGGGGGNGVNTKEVRSLMSSDEWSRVASDCLAWPRSGLDDL